MVTSFADGTKISFEQAIVANAAGFTVPRRGMNGWDHAGHVDELTGMYDVDELRALGGVVDYVVGSKPGPGVYVLATHDDPKQQHYLDLYKLGRGRCTASTRRTTCATSRCRRRSRGPRLRRPDARRRRAPRRSTSSRRPRRDLPAGTVLDGLGGYHNYGEAERADVAHAGPSAAAGRGRGLPAAPRRREGRGAHLRRRRAARRAGWSTGCAPSRTSVLRQPAGVGAAAVGEPIA